MVLRTFFDDIVRNGTVNYNCHEIEDIRSAVTELLQRYASDIGERSIFHVSRIQPCGSMIEKTSLWKTNAEIYQANLRFKRKFKVRYIEFDFLAIMNSKYSILGVKSCSECMVIESVESNRKAETDAKLEFHSIEPDTIDKRFHTELNKSITSMCTCFAGSECNEARFHQRRNVYSYLKKTNSPQLKCDKCTVHRPTGYLQIATFRAGFEAAKHGEQSSCVFKWKSVSKQLRAPYMQDLRKRKRLKNILIYVDFLPAFEFSPFDIEKHQATSEHEETNSSQSMQESDKRQDTTELSEERSGRGTLSAPQEHYSDCNQGKFDKVRSNMQGSLCQDPHSINSSEICNSIQTNSESNEKSNENDTISSDVEEDGNLCSNISSAFDTEKHHATSKNEETNNSQDTVREYDKRRNKTELSGDRSDDETLAAHREQNSDCNRGTYDELRSNILGSVCQDQQSINTSDICNTTQTYRESNEQSNKSDTIYSEEKEANNSCSNNSCSLSSVKSNDLTELKLQEISVYGQNNKDIDIDREICSSGVAGLANNQFPSKSLSDSPVTEQVRSLEGTQDIMDKKDAFLDSIPQVDEYSCRYHISMATNKELGKADGIGNEHVWADVNIMQNGREARATDDHETTRTGSIESINIPKQTHVLSLNEGVRSGQAVPAVTENDDKPGIGNQSDDKNTNETIEVIPDQTQEHKDVSKKPGLFVPELGGDIIVLSKKCTSCGPKCWRMSHSDTENKTILEDLSEEHRKCFIVIKYLFERISLLSTSQMNGYHLKISILRHSSKCLRDDGDFVTCVAEILNDLHAAFSSRNLESMFAERNLLRKPGTPFPLYAKKIQCILEVLHEIKSERKLKACAFRGQYSARKCESIISKKTREEFILQL